MATVLHLLCDHELRSLAILQQEFMLSSRSSSPAHSQQFFHLSADDFQRNCEEVTLQQFHQKLGSWVSLLSWIQRDAMRLLHAEGQLKSTTLKSDIAVAKGLSVSGREYQGASSCVLSISINKICLRITFAVWKCSYISWACVLADRLSCLPLTTWKVSKYRVIFGPNFPAFGLNTEIYLRSYFWSVFSCIRIEYGDLLTELFLVRIFLYSDWIQRFTYGVISGPYFPVFSPNTGKFGPEITLYLDFFHAVTAYMNEIYFLTMRVLPSRWPHH